MISLSRLAVSLRDCSVSPMMSTGRHAGNSQWRNSSIDFSMKSFFQQVSVICQILVQTLGIKRGTSMPIPIFSWESFVWNRVAGKPNIPCIRWWAIPQSKVKQHRKAKRNCGKGCGLDCVIHMAFHGEKPHSTPPDSRGKRVQAGNSKCRGQEGGNSGLSRDCGIKGGREKDSGRSEWESGKSVPDNVNVFSRLVYAL